MQLTLTWQIKQKGQYEIYSISHNYHSGFYILSPHEAGLLFDFVDSYVVGNYCILTLRYGRPPRPRAAKRLVTDGKNNNILAGVQPLQAHPVIKVSG